MPEDAQVNLQALLGLLEGQQNSPDDAIYAKKSHNLLKSLNSLLSCGEGVSSTDADRVFRLCLQYKTDMRCVPYVFSIVSTLINIDKENPINLVDFLPTALAVLDVLKNTCENNTNNIRKMLFQVLMAHPPATLIKLVNNHSPELIETFRLSLTLRPCSESIDMKMESFILLRMLEWLPAQEKTILVKEGISLWLSRVVPILVDYLTRADDKDKIETHLHNVELLAKELVLHDFHEYPEWRTLLESIVDPKKFPMCIKSLLEKGKDTWHRIWIILIKLLKSHITRSVSPFGTTPVNSMLPVIETAFKMESTQRVRAFACWNELIMNFSNEINPNCIAKRIKLIIIPLRAINAKTEDANVAKFHSWWLFIQKFQPKIEKFTKEILITFLHFVFGKFQAPKPSFWVSQLPQSMAQKCLEAFVEILGHSDCTVRCTSVVAPLNGKTVTTTMLAYHWKDFLYALEAAIKVVVMNFTPAAKANIRCIWKSYVLLVAELLDNTVRRDLFDELINLLSGLVEDCKNHVDLSEVLIDDLALPLFRDTRVRTLICSRSQEHRPSHKIVSLITDKAFDSYYERFHTQDLMKMLEPLVATLVNESVAVPAYMLYLLDELPATDGSVKLWMALVRSATESNLCLQNLNGILRWPLKKMHYSTNVKEAALSWYTLYNVVHVKLEYTGFDNEISKVLTKTLNDSEAANFKYFIMFALIGLLKYKPDNDKMAKLETLTSEMDNYKDFEQLIPPLVDTLVLIIDNFSTKIDINLAQITINCVKNVLKVIRSETESSGSPSKSRENTFSELSTNLPSMNKALLSDSIMSAMKTYLTNCPNELIKYEIRNVIASYDKQRVESPVKSDVASKEFASPKIKITKRREASIVNTVFENGEEYMVVKSTWKFNPKNLTENQKEKFQRKSDIPALYQDLTQSQDEFKLATWKTDSQDTSLSSSKSSKSSINYNATEILRNMPSTDVVPKIMENILDNNKTTTPKTDANTSPVSKDKVLKEKMSPLVGTKSPRMALKDRVFHNVRNLIEKSLPALQNEVTDKQENTNQIEKNSTTSVTKPNILVDSVIQDTVSKPKKYDDFVTDNLIKYNAPDIKTKNVTVLTAKKNNQHIRLVCAPKTKTKQKINDPVSTTLLLSAERPARMKRKPKKYDDSMLLGYKKSRNSNHDDSMSDSQISQDSQPEITVAQVHTSNEKSDNTEKYIDKAQKDDTTVGDDAIYLGNENNAQTVTDNNVILSDKEVVMNFDVPTSKDHIESRITEEAILITPTTPSVDKPIAQSPEKPTTIGEVPSHKSKASQGVENDAALVTRNEIDEELSRVNTPLYTQFVKKSVVQKETNGYGEKSESVTTPLEKNIEVSQDKLAEKNKNVQIENNKNEKNVAVLTPKNKVKHVAQKSSMKKPKKSRIESELMIDMVEGHPFLKVQTDKRITRKKNMETENSSRRKSLTEKLHKSKLAATPKPSKKTKEKKTSTLNTVTVEESQDRRMSSPKNAIMDEPPCSEDIIESSQDSTITTISVKSTKRTPKHLPFVAIEKLNVKTTETQDLIQDFEMIDKENYDSTDIELPQNKTAELDIYTTDLTANTDTEPMGDGKNTIDLTENMDTQPIGDGKITIDLTKNKETELNCDNIAPNDVILPGEMVSLPTVINSEPVVGPETQELAEADTQPNDPNDFIGLEIFEVTNIRQPSNNPSDTAFPEKPRKEIKDNDITLSLPEAALILANMDNTNEVSSPLKDDRLRKQDFLNNTLEISPIKILSPDREKESPPPENSSDFVVIKLTSPVHSNGEPFEKPGSPEFFTEDKVSPDKRNASPPRADVTVTNTSPSSSLSLKKNRPQVRPGGRAAQMLGLLCVNSDLKITKVSERTDLEETNKAGTSTPARRNLRILYNSAGDDSDNLPEQNAGENFLKLKRTLPTVTSSPSGPILKRKLADVLDEASVSPASKRKRVSFHDPPVSTTVSVLKYIEPISLARSPQSSAKKRLERQTRTSIKSPKKLENVFNLDSVLSKTLESFTETATLTDDTQNISLDITPTVEIVKTSELNDTDPIYPDLINCKEPIDVIATELSSTAMRELLIKELEGKVETVGDLAKMTELEVNRLCIKAPKIKVATKVLTDYAAQRSVTELIETVIEEAFSEPMTESLLMRKTASVDMQTDEVDLSSTEMQTDEVELRSTEMQTNEVELRSTEMQTVSETLAKASTQTESVPAAHSSVQTDESSSKITADIISSCLTERGDILEKVVEQLEEEQIKTIAETLPPKCMIDLLMKKGDDSTSPAILRRLLKVQSKGAPKDEKSSAELSFLRDHLFESYDCNRYDSKDLILLCTQLLKKVHDKPVGLP